MKIHVFIFIILGDEGLKPCVTSEPEFLNVQLDGTEDFLVLASDGLWDFVEDNDVATEIYKFLIQYPGNFSFMFYLFP